MISAFEQKMDRINNARAYRFAKECHLRHGDPMPSQYAEQMKSDPDFQKKSRKSKKK